MAKAITARRKGDDYQSRIFWLQLLQLRTGDFVESVTLESDGVSFVDDVVVTYKPTIKDQVTGQDICCDFQQCKYHVAGGGSFNHTNLTDPAFINSESSLLRRLYDAYQSLKTTVGEGGFLVSVVSNWNWHPDDELVRHIGEKAIRPSFYAGGPKSQAGRIRRQLAEHLGITQASLKDFLDTIRFRLGRDLQDLRDELEPQLKLAGLRPLGSQQTGCMYDDLTWKLFGQGRNRYDRRAFDALIREENLIAPMPGSYSEVSIRSRLEFAHRPRDLQAAYLDLCDLFDGRFARSASSWRTDIPNRTVAFFRSERLQSLPQPIHIFFDCHLSIAFLAGHLMNPKYGLQVVPAQKTRQAGYEFWVEPAKPLQDSLWILDRVGGDVGDEVVVGISVTNPIDQHLSQATRALKLDSLPQLHFKPAAGIGPRAVRDGEHAWSLGYEIQGVLRKVLPAACKKMHLFLSAPAALAYILGNTLRFVVPVVQLYEHDFEGATVEHRYYESILLADN